MYSRIANVVYIALCICGLSWQVYEHSSNYFLFDVSTSIQLQYSDQLPDDALNVCFPYHRIFLFEKYNLHTNQNIVYDFKDTESRSIVELFYSLTVDEILKYSPSIDETIENCEVRNMTPGETMSHPTGQECLKFFQVSKYVSAYYICYRFILKTKTAEGFDDAMIAFDTVEPYVVSLIEFNISLFNQVAQFIALYNSRDSLPTEELIQATSLDRILQSDNQVMYNSFGVRYKEDRIQNLEPPYTTKCRNAVARDHYLACVNESFVSAFNRLSPMSQHANGSLKLMCSTLLQNITSLQKYLDIIQDCRKMFHWKDCNFTSFTSSNDEKIRWKTFQIFSMLPDEYDVLIGTRARLLLLDYMTLCFSCFGTWLGFSVLGLNPFKGSKGQSVAPVQNEPVLRSRIRPIYQTQTIRLLLETVKQQQEWMVQMDQESQTVRNELEKLARKLPR